MDEEEGMTVTDDNIDKEENISAHEFGSNESKEDRLR